MHPTSLARSRTLSSFVLPLLGVALAAATAEAQSITTDRIAYPAGDVALLKGSGFTPGGTVALEVSHSGCSSTAGSQHLPWWTEVEPDGSFATTWDVCAGGCVGHTVEATAFSEFGETARTQFGDTLLLPCGQAVASLSAEGGSCLEFSAAQGSGADSWAVVEGGSYSLTLTGVTECSADELLVFAQGIGTSNFCFTASRLGSSTTFVGAFTMPDAACQSYRIKYRCGLDCTEAGAVDARGPTSECGGAELRASQFDGNCNWLGDDLECGPCVCTGAPVFDNVVGETIDLGCNPSFIPGCDPGVTAHDNCGPVEVICGFNEGPLPGCRRGRRVVYTAVNDCEGAKVDVLYLWKVDVVAPTFVNPPGDLSLDCNPANVPGPSNVTASDNCGPASVTSTVDDTSNGCERTRTITYTASDECGNQAVHVQRITWIEDTTAPKFDNVPNDVSLGCNPSNIPGASDVTASDNCGSATVTSSVSDSADGCGRTRTITYIATDACGNQASDIQLIHWTSDSTPPVFVNPPGDIYLGCNPTSIPGASNVSANDNCGPANVTYTSFDATSGCIRTRTITYRALDACGNQAVHVQLISWTYDKTAPTFVNAPGNVDLGCNPASIPGPADVSANDNCGGSVNVTSTMYDSSNGCDRKRKITYKATDACGNIKSHVQYITWMVDTTAPTIQCCAPDITVAANGQCSKTVNFSCYEPSAWDNCGGCSLDIIPPTQPAGGYPIGTTNVVWTVRDQCGNTAVCNSKVKVLGQIRATKYYDSNANGVRDLGEPGVDHWKIQVRQGWNLIATGYTNSSGNAYFNVPAGTYTVSECTPNQNNWVATRPTSVNVVVDAANCSATATFGNYCYEAPCDGSSIGYWCTTSGKYVLNSTNNYPDWAYALNASSLRKANGSPFTVPTNNKSSAVSSLLSWLGGASSSNNMAYVLSAQLASTVLNVTCHQGLKDSDTAVVRGGTKVGSTCLVSYLGAQQSISCGSPLLSLTAVPGSSSCGCSTNNALVTIGDLRARAVCLLGAYSNTTSSSAERTYQECVKAILDMINNDGNPSGSAAYSCGGVAHFINSPCACCDPSF